MPDIVGLAAVLCVFGIPIIAIVTSHQRRMIELKLRLREAAGKSSTEDLAALREEVRQLRETATQYDLSFDAMLQRLEQRVERLEGQVRTIQGTTTGISAVLGEARGDP